jgi:hypothetical protein
VRGGLLSMSDACARYCLTMEEFLNWQAQVDRNGLKGLRATRVQDYRSLDRHKGLSDVGGPSTRSEGGRFPQTARYRA